MYLVDRATESMISRTMVRCATGVDWVEDELTQELQSGEGVMGIT